jgi:mercuric ion transport protein
MKQLFVLAILGIALFSCQGNSSRDREIPESERPEITVAPENLSSISFDVEGMTCTGCESTVVRSVKSMNGVVEANASHETGKATVQFDKTLIDMQALEAAIESRGYKVKGYSPVE